MHSSHARSIRSVRIHAGQGDVMMAVHGLQALREVGAQFLASDVCIYARSDTEALVRALLPEFEVAPLTQARGVAHPRYVIVQHLSWTTVLRNLLTSDWYVNFPERRLLASYGYPRPGASRRAQLFITDFAFGGPRDWRREAPAYYAVKMWAPLARALGLSEIDLTRGLYSAHATLRTRLLHHVARLPVEPLPRLAFFPSGRGFQYLPPAFVRTLSDRAGMAAGESVCYFGPNDPTIADYRAAGIPCETTTLDRLLAIVARVPVVATSDSFVSHVAQLISREHVALMSHDLPVHTIHPAARSHIVFVPQPCSPCFYQLRDPGARCAAGHDACGVYSMPSYLETAAHAIQRALISDRT